MRAMPCRTWHPGTRKTRHTAANSRAPIDLATGQLPGALLASYNRRMAIHPIRGSVGPEPPNRRHPLGAVVYGLLHLPGTQSAQGIDR